MFRRRRNAWAYGEKPTSDSHFVFSSDTTRQIGVYATFASSSLSFMLSRSCYTHTATHTRSYSHVSSPSHVRSPAFEGYVRFLPPTSRQIVAQLIDRPTVVWWNLNLLRFPLFFSLSLSHFSSLFFCYWMRDEPIYIRIAARKREKKRKKERVSDSYFRAADVMTVLVANCQAPAILVTMIYQASRNHPCDRCEVWSVRV